MNILEQDIKRYHKENMPKFQYFFRKTKQTDFAPLRLLYKCLFVLLRNRRLIELPIKTQIGGGLYFGHAYNITINPNVVIGSNCNIHKGVLIGQENRGRRQGTPTIGDFVWIGINACIVGNIHIGNDVLIAPNTYINRDIPSHSVVFGNPCIIKTKKNATEGYINHTSYEILNEETRK